MEADGSKGPSCTRAYDPQVDAGTRVEVRSRFDRAWARGFEVAEAVIGSDPGYRIRRRSDGSVLPVVFSCDDVREERRRNDMWWV
jgi:hypothetical protein